MFIWNLNFRVPSTFFIKAFHYRFTVKSYRYMSHCIQFYNAILILTALLVRVFKSFKYYSHDCRLDSLSETVRISFLLSTSERNLSEDNGNCLYSDDQGPQNLKGRSNLWMLNKSTNLEVCTSILFFWCWGL